MASSPTFVSFTKHGDDDFVRRLIARLRVQDLDIWLYEEDGQDVPGGENLQNYLRSQILRCNFFIPLVSVNAFQSKHTRFEVQCALDLVASQPFRRIVPLVARKLAENVPSEEWTPPYNALGALKYWVVDFDSEASLEEVLIELCADLGVEYQPPIPEHPRFPFLCRFVKEVQGKCPRRYDREIGAYCRLMNMLNLFGRHIEAECWSGARETIELFCLLIHFEFPQVNFYYPLVARGVCELLCEDLRQSQKTFEELLEHPRADEAVFGGLGHIYQRQGNYSAALACYRRALSSMPEDPAAQVGVVVNTVLSGNSADDVEDICRNANLQLDVDGSAERAVSEARLIAYANSRQYGLAQQEFGKLAASGTPALAVLLHFARLLHAKGTSQEAIQLLEQYRSDYGDLREFPQWQSAYARYLAGAGNIPAAISATRALMEAFPANRSYRIDCARYLSHQGKQAEARQLAREQLESKEFPLPAQGSDFYYDGFANWILGRFDRAEYDFSRSGYNTKFHYQQLMHKAVE